MTEEKKALKVPIEKTAVDIAFESENKKLLKEGKMLVRTNSKFAGYTGSTPFIEVDMDWQQMPLDRTTLSIPRENLTRMFPLAYLAGKLSTLDQGSKTSLLMIVLFILVIGLFVFIFWTGSSTKDQLKTMGASTDQRFTDTNKKIDDISTIQMMIAVKSGINISEIMDVTNSSIPTVGG